MRIILLVLSVVSMMGVLSWADVADIDCGASHYDPSRGQRTRMALTKLDQAGEVGLLNHMPCLHYFSVGIPFYGGHPSISANEIVALVADLSSDDVKGNATAAWEKLIRIGAGAQDQLIGALGGADEQQRILAASILGRVGGEKAIEALISQLHDDHIPHNALSAYLALLEVGARALPQLRAVVESNDKQQAVFSKCLVELLSKPD